MDLLERLESNPDIFKVFSRGNQNLSSSLQISSKIITNKCPRHSIQNILFKNYKIDQNLLPDFVKKKKLVAFFANFILAKKNNAKHFRVSRSNIWKQTKKDEFEWNKYNRV